MGGLLISSLLVFLGYLGYSYLEESRKQEVISLKVVRLANEKTILSIESKIDSPVLLSEVRCLFKTSKGVIRAAPYGLPLKLDAREVTSLEFDNHDMLSSPECESKYKAIK